MKKIDRGCCRFLPIVWLLVMIGPVDVHALDVNGIIASDTNWTNNDSPVHVIGDILVDRAATLTIDPGVEVIFDSRADTTRGYNLTVEGALFARGEEARIIAFTAQDRTLPWGAIVFRDTSTDWDAAQSSGSILSYCLIEYGGNNPDGGAMIVTENAMPRMANNAIRFSSTAGVASLATDGAASISGDVQIIDNQIYNNPTGLVLAAEGGLAQGNYFLNNGSAVNVATRTNPVQMYANTISGSSGELFGAGVLLELGEPDSGIMDYQWVQTGGPTVVLDNPNSVRASFTAPDPGADVYTLTFDLTVTGSNALQATESAAVTVVGENEPPVAAAGGDQNVQLSDDPEVDVEVTLNGVGSFDPFIGIGGYRWDQVAGRPVALQTPNSVTATFVVPASVVAGEQMTFQLTVIDRGGLQSTDTVDVRFYEDNIFPVAAAGDDITAIQGQTVTLDGSASRDPDGGITAYLWTQAGGTSVSLFNVNTARPFFIAPAVDQGSEALTFALGVRDTGGLVDADEMAVEVKGLTIADAGEDQTVSADAQVTLDGSGSVDLDAAGSVDIEANTILSDNAAAGLVAISALEGARYQLFFSGNNLSFAEDAGYSAYLFDWVDATESLGMTANWWGTAEPAMIDAMIIDQNDDPRLPVVEYQPFATQPVADAGSLLNYPPLANAGPDLETAVDLSVTLDGSNSYDPDSIGDYQWRQVEGPTVTINDSQRPVATFIAPSGGTDGQLLRFTLTMGTGGPFYHTDEVTVTIDPNVPVPVVEVGGGCFIQSITSQNMDANKMRALVIMTIVGTLAALLFWRRQRKPLVAASLAALMILCASEARAGYFAVGGGGGGDADQYNITLETGAKDIAIGKADTMFGFGIPFIPHGDKNLPDTTIAFPCPNNDCRQIDSERKGTEVGFYGKLGIELGSTNLYINAIGGFTVYTESQLSRSTTSGAYYEESSDTTIEALYGVGLSYFPDQLDWPIMIQVDYDVTRGVTGTIGWYW